MMNVFCLSLKLGVSTLLEEVGGSQTKEGLRMRKRSQAQRIMGVGREEERVIQEKGRRRR